MLLITSSPPAGLVHAGKGGNIILDFWSCVKVSLPGRQRVLIFSLFRSRYLSFSALVQLREFQEVFLFIYLFIFCLKQAGVRNITSNATYSGKGVKPRENECKLKAFCGGRVIQRWSALAF